MRPAVGRKAETFLIQVEMNNKIKAILIKTVTFYTDKEASGGKPSVRFMFLDVESSILCANFGALVTPRSGLVWFKRIGVTYMLRGTVMEPMSPSVISSPTQVMSICRERLGSKRDDWIRIHTVAS